MVDINIVKIDNGFLVKADYGFQIVDGTGEYLKDTVHYASSMDEVRDKLAHIGIRLQTAEYKPEQDDLL
jgi:hypothetical protein